VYTDTCRSLLAFAWQGLNCALTVGGIKGYTSGVKAPPEAGDYDVIIVGGALSGAASAILLLKRNPQLRVLIVERSARFDRKVGEATVEVSAFFLRRVLGLSTHLNDAHLTKQGLRFWFYRDPQDCFEEASEIGGRYLARIPSYQLDRAVLDEEVLRKAVSLGAELLRPVQVREIELNAGGLQKVAIGDGGREKSFRARWVIDASGPAAFLARQQGWFRLNTAHPTASLWARWTGVKDWDGEEMASRHPEWAGECYGLRNTATNHFMGPGWWAWCIPLRGGDVSVGVVFDQRLVEMPPGPSLGERLKTFLMRHPVAREILEHAQVQPGDVHWRRNLAYSSETMAGDGFFLVGDAAGFMDPFYSPGMDWISYTTSAAANVIVRERAGEDVSSAVELHNATFKQSYARWFEALYLNKYEYMGEFDLMRIAFQLDIALYYLGVVSRPIKEGAEALLQPVFANKESGPVFKLMSLYNRRLATMARQRRLMGRSCERNRANRFLVPGFSLCERQMSGLVLKTLIAWLKLELKEGWRTWWNTPPEPALIKTRPDAAEGSRAAAPLELAAR